MTAVDVNQWLQRRYKFQAPLDWLEECCAWLLEENNGRTLPPTELRSQVLNQWLVSDLREVGMRSLPAALNQQAKLLLQGSYCLQVNATYDVSTSFYSQLQKVSGTENENVLVSATQNSQTQQPASGRMLMFEMTDGLQSVKGMEYRQLPGVDDTLTPGAKVIVSGPVLCRQGVLMLEPKNWMLLGGEVDTLVENSNRISVLQRVLASNKERQPMETLRQTFSERELPAKQEPKNMQQDATMVNDDEDDFLTGLDLSQLDDWERQISTPNPNTHTSGGATLVDRLTSRNITESKYSGNNLKKSSNSTAVVSKGNNVQTTSHSSIVSENTCIQHSQPVNVKANNTRISNHSAVINRPPHGKCDDKNQTLPHGVNTSTCVGQMLWDDDDDDFDAIVQTLREPIEQNCALQSNSAENNDEAVEIDVQARDSPQTDSAKNDVQFCSNERTVNHEKGLSAAGHKVPVPVTLSSAPYTYLQLVKNALPSGQHVTVKAYVSTLLGHLEHNAGQYWSLAVKLNDGTASTDVDLSNSFLTTLIGFSASECHAMKLRAKTCSQTRLRIAQGLRRCQQSLIQLYGLIQMELIQGRQRPLVVGCSEITDVEVQALKSRLL